MAVLRMEIQCRRMADALRTTAVASAAAQPVVSEEREAPVASEADMCRRVVVMPHLAVAATLHSEAAVVAVTAAAEAVDIAAEAGTVIGNCNS